MRIEEIRSSLAKRLRARRGEIEQAALTRIRSVSSSAESADPEYLDGLRVAVSAALDYGIGAVGRSEDHPPPMPTVLLAQARLAARHGVKLETVLRRYLAGHTLLGDFLIEESARDGLMNGASLKRLLRVQAALLDRLIATVSEEYAREADARAGSAEQRRAERVERLLTGELLDTTELAYDLDAHHLGVIASGPGAEETIGALVKALDSRHLVVRRDEMTVWVWFGSRRRIDADEIERQLPPSRPAGASLAIGEPGHAFAGWRLTHMQARAALPIAQADSPKLTRYADVALLASIRQDDVLVASLRLFYLDPLSRVPDGGVALRKTLRAYFSTDRNTSSAAAMLGVDRHTVTKRIRAAEDCIGRPFDDCAVDLQMALRLEESLQRSPNWSASAPSRSHTGSAAGS